MKIKYRLLKIIITVIALFFLLNFSLKRFSEKDLDIISVKFLTEEVDFISKKEVKNIVKRENPTLKVGSLNTAQIENKIRQNPFVDSANVYLNLNGTLNIDIVQKVPIFRLSKGNRTFYVDKNGSEFPISRHYSYLCMLVSGNVNKEEYPQIIDLIEKINQDSFSKGFFVGISKEKNDYYLATSNGEYLVEIGDLENIDFKLNGFKTFVEKYLIYQEKGKYSKISLKYENQIVTTLRNGKTESEEKKEPKQESEKKKEI